MVEAASRLETAQAELRLLRADGDGATLEYELALLRGDDDSERGTSEADSETLITQLI